MPTSSGPSGGLAVRNIQIKSDVVVSFRKVPRTLFPFGRNRQSLSQADEVGSPGSSCFVTNQTVELFNPRTDKWSEHLEWFGPLLVSKYTDWTCSHSLSGYQSPG